ncbi:hypothetical protein [Thermocrinis sp.]|jgi:hypothetical protein|uniref:hypothetical protein n=1 Tax=Thermocrinis sp. TaxID=2024383 RepID=UPI003C0DC375
MKKLLTFTLLVFLSLFAFAQQKPEPFGLKLGISTKEETMKVIEKEGGKVVDSGYKVIKGDVVNPNVEGVEVEELPVYNLTSATFWFFKGKLYRIEYLFPLSMNKEEFYVIFEQLRKKYGNPRRYVEPYLADGVAEWDFGDVRMSLIAPWVSWSMYLIYEHTPTAREVEKNDQEVFDEEIAKRSMRGL